MLPISSKRRVAFTPAGREAEEPKPVYFLRVPTIEDKVEYGLALANPRPAGLVTRSQFCAEARKVIAALAPGNMGELMELLDRVAEVEDIKPIEGVDAEQFGSLEEWLMANHEPYAKLVERNQRFWALAPVLAAKMFLVGWTSGPDGQDRVASAIDDDARNMIPEPDLRAIGWKAWQMMHVSEAQAKN
jgi:hypothetical protein